MKNKIGLAAVIAFNFGALYFCLTSYNAEPFWASFAMGVSFTVLGSVLLEK